MSFARTVVVEPVVQEYIQEEIRRYNRLEDIFNGLVWRLARQPEVGLCLPNYTPPRWLVKSHPFRLPVPLILTLMYRYTDKEVIIELARVDADAGE